MRKVVMAFTFLVALSALSWSADGTTFDAVMEHYEPIRLALLEDSMDGVNANGKAIAGELRALDADFSADRAGADGESVEVVRKSLAEMIAAADSVASAATIDAARDGFYALSKPMVRWRQGVAESGRPAVAYCPMHKRSWLQPDEEIGNPYGNMPRCGEIVAR